MVAAWRCVANGWPSMLAWPGAAPTATTPPPKAVGNYLPGVRVGSPNFNLSA